MAKLKSTAAKKARHSGYTLDNRAEKNKIRKLERHLKKYPDDNQTLDALSKIKKSGYRKKVAPKGSLYPIVVVETFGKKKGPQDDSSPRVRVVRIGRKYAMSIKKAKASLNAAEKDPLFWMTPEQRKANSESKKQKDRYGLDPVAIDVLKELKESK